MSFEEEVDIDKHNLDEEWLKQSMLCHKWLEEYVIAVETRDKLKQKIKVIEKDELEKVRATIDLEVRSDPKKFVGENKLTENYISNLIITHPDYIAALKSLRRVENELIEANSTLNSIEGGKDIIFYQRKATLEYLSELYKASYFIRNVVPKDTRERNENKIQQEQEQSLAQNPRLKKLVRKT